MKKLKITIGVDAMRQENEVKSGEHEVQSQNKPITIAELLLRAGVEVGKGMDDEQLSKIKQITSKKRYHNTKLLMEKYRTLLWVLECSPCEIAAELNIPLAALDAILAQVDLELALENKRLEARLRALVKTRVLVDQVHDALMVMKRRPDNGQLLYDLIYQTYIEPEPKTILDIVDDLDISPRSYYRLKKEALAIMSIRLWSSPCGEIDSWMEMLEILERS